MHSIGVFRNGTYDGNSAYAYDFLALIHRKHKCDRNIGVAHRYDIQNETELIIKRSWDWKLGSSFIEWDDKEHRFKF